jgi:hypothetical protein
MVTDRRHRHRSPTPRPPTPAALSALLIAEFVDFNAMGRLLRVRGLR